MKKVGVLVLISIILFSSLIFAAEDITDPLEETIPTTNSNLRVSIDAENLKNAYSCLESEVITNCDSLDVSEIALAILSKPDSEVLDECVSALEKKKTSEDCFQSSSNSCDVKSTALAILALNSQNKNAADSEKWLISQNKTSSEIEWFLQIDTDAPSACSIKSLDSTDRLTINENKKLEFTDRQGSCLSLARSNYLVRVDPSCYGETFEISCEQNFITSANYQQPGSQILFVTESEDKKAAYDKFEIEIDSKCFSSGGNSCEYESTLWATLALKNKINIDPYISYIEALGESNSRLFPNSFLYQLTAKQVYKDFVIDEKKTENFWQAELTPYSPYYDTALAILALGSSSKEVQDAKKRLASSVSQNSEGCWGTQNQIRDTAIVLWSFNGLSGIGGGTGTSSVTYCSEQQGFSCVPKADCDFRDTKSNYFCSGPGKVCCDLETSSPDNTDAGEDTPPTIDKGLDSNDEESSSKLWIWILVIVIFLVIGAIMFLLREKLKLFLFKLKTKFKKDKGSNTPQNARSPGPPGLPPANMQFRPAPPRRQPIRPTQSTVNRARRTSMRDKPIDNVFKKLREMGG
jgi:hypothetical protein